MHTFRNLFSLLTLCLTLSSLTACLGDGGEIHETHMTSYSGTSDVLMYADQTVDSIYIVSFDSWRAEVSVNEATPWVTISPKSADIPKGYAMATNMVVRTELNKTGHVRIGNVQMVTAYDGFGSFHMPIQQFGWLNISRPAPRFTSEKASEAEAVFEATFGPKATDVPLTFKVWGFATVTSDAEWLTVPEDKRSVQPGEYPLILKATENTTGADRVAHVEVVSNGITNVVTYKQTAK